MGGEVGRCPTTIGRWRQLLLETLVSSRQQNRLPVVSFLKQVLTNYDSANKIELREITVEYHPYLKPQFAIFHAVVEVTQNDVEMWKCPIPPRLPSVICWTSRRILGSAATKLSNTSPTPSYNVIISAWRNL